MANTPVATVVGGGADIRMLHEFGQIALRCRPHQMKMIAHDHVGMKFNLVDRQGAPKLLDQGRPVPGVFENSFALVTPGGHVVVTAWNQNP